MKVNLQNQSIGILEHTISFCMIKKKKNSLIIYKQYFISMFVLIIRVLKVFYQSSENLPDTEIADSREKLCYASNFRIP